MSVSGDTGGAGKKAPRRLGGMAEALAIASDLGFSIPPVQVIIFVLSNGLATYMLNSSRNIVSCEHLQDDQQGLSNSLAADKGDDLIRVLRELTTVQRNIANLQVELQGRKVKKQMLPYSFFFF
ncbi:hypothetical protein GW17_00054736 [Ensete ventricosum]|nr:hypothetical protein GW17_00054736 [Ensete ventricosum]